MEYEKRQAHIKKEKAKAKKIRQSHWWQSICQNATCYYCEKKLLYEEVTMDHVVPLSKGGKSTKGNIVASCKECNTKKKDQTAVDLILKGKAT